MSQYTVVELFPDYVIKSDVARPFVKWVGGKGNLLETLESQLPDDFDTHDDVTYIEPFVGGGAMMFHMINKHNNIKRVLINDINEDLIRCYQLIKDSPEKLIEILNIFNQTYIDLSEEGKERFYYNIRNYYNNGTLESDQRAAAMIFLNQTCFRGMYRENSEGAFNVPFGNYEKPNICNIDVIMADHKALQKVEIFSGDYKKIFSHIGKSYSFIYLDPPYRPLFDSDNFNQYSKSGFGDKEQKQLKKFCDKLSRKGCKIMLSNSYSTNEDGSSFFETLYEEYNCDKILAPRYINAYAKKREKQVEILITNYENHAKNSQ